MTDEELKRMLAEHREDFGEFTDDWKVHRSEARIAMSKIDAVHSSLASIAPNMAHLAQLPLIANSIASIERGNSTQLTTLITQAGAAGKSGSKIVERALLTCALVVIFLGVTLLLLFLRESTKDVHIGTNGISITQQQEKKTSKD